jgi:hypothetical protein
MPTELELSGSNGADKNEDSAREVDQDVQIIESPPVKRTLQVSLLDMMGTVAGSSKALTVAHLSEFQMSSTRAVRRHS